MVFDFKYFNFLLHLYLLPQILQELTLWLLHIITHVPKSLHSATSHLVHLIILTSSSSIVITISTPSPTWSSPWHLVLKRRHHPRHKLTTTLTTVWRRWHPWHKGRRALAHVLLWVWHHVHWLIATHPIEHLRRKWLLLIKLSPLVRELRRHKVLLVLLIKVWWWRRRWLVDVSFALVHLPLKVLLITVPLWLHVL